MRIGELFEQDEKRVIKLGRDMMTIPMDEPAEDDEPEEGKPLVIKLGSKRTTTAAQRFMDEYAATTHEHPFNHRMRYFEDGPVLVSMSASSDFEDEIDLHDIQSKAPGAGARAMKVLCQIADTHDVTIDLYAQGYGDVPTLKLVEYYQRFGFQVRNEMDVEAITKFPKDHGVDMVRYPT